MKNFSLFLCFIVSLVLITSQVYGKDEHGHDHGKKKVQRQKDEHGHDHGEDKNEEGHDEHGHDEHGHEEGGPIELSEESQKLGGIKTAVVGSSPYAAKVSVSGRIAQDVENVTYVVPQESATIKECNVSLGAPVKTGDIICTATSASSDEMFEIKSPITGTIISEFSKNGEHVDETTAIYAIADLTKLYANFDVYEKDIAAVKLGQKIKVYPLAYPNRVFQGKVVFISPRVDESTFTVKIRALVDNPADLMKLGMSVRGEILADSNSSLVTIPTEAIQTVENKTVVFKKTPEGFIPQEVTVQSQTKETAAIKNGLEKGDEIAVKGSFILKSKTMEGEMGHDHAH